MGDSVNHPDHYTMGKIEVIEVVEDWGLGFNDGNVIKYLGRARHKNNEKEDCEKALWYLVRHLYERFGIHSVDIVEKMKSVVKIPKQNTLLDPVVDSLLEVRGIVVKNVRSGGERGETSEMVEDVLVRATKYVIRNNECILRDDLPDTDPSSWFSLYTSKYDNDPYEEFGVNWKEILLEDL